VINEKEQVSRKEKAQTIFFGFRLGVATKRGTTKEKISREKEMHVGDGGAEYARDLLVGCYGASKKGSLAHYS
jgi:hypothetical protein